jgi:hypothetical protein
MDEPVYRRIVSPSGRVQYVLAGRLYSDTIPSGVHAVIVPEDSTTRTTLYRVDPRPPTRAWLLTRVESAVDALRACEGRASSTLERVEAVLQAVDPDGAWR